MCTAVPAICRIFTAPHRQATIFNWMYQRCYCRYLDYSRSLYCQHSGKCSAYTPVYAVWTVFRAIYKVFTAPHMYASVFSSRYLRCYCRYHIYPMRVILQTWWEIQRTSSSLRYVYCGPGHKHSIYSSAYLSFNIQLKVTALLLP
jgi:hypothetical protein